MRHAQIKTKGQRINSGDSWMPKYATYIALSNRFFPLFSIEQNNHLMKTNDDYRTRRSTSIIANRTEWKQRKRAGERKRCSALKIVYYAKQENTQTHRKCTRNRTISTDKNVSIPPESKYDWIKWCAVVIVQKLFSIAILCLSVGRERGYLVALPSPPRIPLTMGTSVCLSVICNMMAFVHHYVVNLVPRLSQQNAIKFDHQHCLCDESVGWGSLFSVVIVVVFMCVCAMFFWFLFCCCCCHLLLLPFLLLWLLVHTLLACFVKLWQVFIPHSGVSFQSPSLPFVATFCSNFYVCLLFSFFACIAH